jgi:hypothetical protein
VVEKYASLFPPGRQRLILGVPVPATPEAIEKFIQDVVAEIGDRRNEEVLRKRLRDGLVVTIQKEDLAAIKRDWQHCAANSEKIAESDYLLQHADLLRDLVCDATTNPGEIAEGIIRIWISDDPNRRDYSSRLARGLLGLDGKGCEATDDLRYRAKERLREFASTSPPAN